MEMDNIEKEKIRKRAEVKAGIYDFQGRRDECKNIFVGKFDIFTDEEKKEIIENGIKNYKP